MDLLQVAQNVSLERSCVSEREIWHLLLTGHCYHCFLSVSTSDLEVKIHKVNISRLVSFCHHWPRCMMCIRLSELCAARWRGAAARDRHFMGISNISLNESLKSTDFDDSSVKSYVFGDGHSISSNYLTLQLIFHHENTAIIWQTVKPCF